jgi:MraZ protein
MATTIQQLADSALPLGSQPRAIDSSGRLLIKGQVPDGTTAVIFTFGLDNQILMMLPEQWLAFRAFVDKLDQFDPDVQNIKRYQVAPAEGCSVDNAGRVRIPEDFRVDAHLTTPGVAQILNLGSDGYELWLPERYKAARESKQEGMREAQLRLSRQAAAQVSQPPSGV